MATVSGGDKAKQRLAALSALVTNATEVRIGFLSGATYPARPRPALRATYKNRDTKGTQGAVKGATGGTRVAMVAAILEFGAPRAGIPPRPYFRNMIRNKSKEWPTAIENLLKANKYDANKTLQQVGAAIAGQLVQSIRDTNDPPLAQSTIRRKGFAKPLIDTSHLIHSVDYEVK